MMLRQTLALVRREPVVKEIEHVEWDVFLGIKKLTTVSYNINCTAQYVRTSLIQHDGYDANIVVRRRKAIPQ